MAACLMQIQKVQKEADVIEIWLDQIEDLNLERLFQVKKKPYLCVCKSKREKGKFVGSTDKRLEILYQCIARGAEYVDINNEAPVKKIKDLIAHKQKSEVIVSYHSFENTPSFKVLSRICRRMTRLGADICKIATNVRTVDDIATLFKLAHFLQKNGHKHIVLGMGEMGKITRIYSPTLGNVLTFAPVEKEKVSAPGQLTVAELNNLWQSISR
jgi:3-dehydroquinate dehydratase type I